MAQVASALFEGLKNRVSRWGGGAAQWEDREREGAERERQRVERGFGEEGEQTSAWWALLGWCEDSWCWGLRGERHRAFFLCVLWELGACNLGRRGGDVRGSRLCEGEGGVWGGDPDPVLWIW